MGNVRRLNHVLRESLKRNPITARSHVLGVKMFDHVVFSTSDYEASKTFFLKA